MDSLTKIIELQEMWLNLKSDNKIMADGIGLLFIVAIPVLMFVLTLIPLSSNADVDLPFLTDSKASKVLVFGGFPSCSSACPISLSTLQQVYSEYNNLSDENDLEVIFVNIKLNTPREVSNAYAKSFHPDFQGFSALPSHAEKLYQGLSMKTFYSQEEIKGHTGFIYLFSSINKKWKLKNIFNSDVAQKKILNHLFKKTA